MDKKEIIDYLASIRKMVNNINSGNISHQKPNTLFILDMLTDKIKNETINN